MTEVARPEVPERARKRLPLRPNPQGLNTIIENKWHTLARGELAGFGKPNPTDEEVTAVVDEHRRQFRELYGIAPDDKRNVGEILIGVLQDPSKAAERIQQTHPDTKDPKIVQARDVLADLGRQKPLFPRARKKA